MAESKELKLQRIDRDGDIILVVGTPRHKPQKTRPMDMRKLLVSSTTLIRASRVFATMLGPNFREGQELAASTQPTEICLPDDKPDAMAHM